MAPKLTIEWLRYADAIADTGSFNAAAHRLGLTQPALSLSIAKFEDYLGGQLFVRGSKGATPTPFGDTVLPRINRVIIDLLRMEAEVKAYISRDNGMVRIGVSPPVDRTITATLRSAVHGPGALSDGRDLTLLESELDVLEESLRTQDIDLLVVGALGAMPGYSRRTIDSDYLVLVEPEIPGEDNDSVEPRGNTITLQEVSRYDLILSRNGCGITRTIKDAFSREGFPLRRSEVEVSSCAALLGCASRGMGVVVYPERSVPDDMKTRRIVRADNSPVGIDFEAVWDPASENAVFLQALVETVTISNEKLLWKTR